MIAIKQIPNRFYSGPISISVTENKENTDWENGTDEEKLNHFRDVYIEKFVGPLGSLPELVYSFEELNSKYIVRYIEKWDDREAKRYIVFNTQCLDSPLEVILIYFFIALTKCFQKIHGKPVKGCFDKELQALLFGMGLCVDQAMRIRKIQEPFFSILKEQGIFVDEYELNTRLKGHNFDKSKVKHSHNNYTCSCDHGVTIKCESNDLDLFCLKCQSFFHRVD